MRRRLVGVVFLTACSSGRTQADCETIAEQVRQAVMARGLPTQGVCNNPSASDLKATCDDLRACNVEAHPLVAPSTVG